MKHMNNKYKVIIFGLLVHLLLLLAVCDIYFGSPIDHGMKVVKSTPLPPAKRVVLFVADGLRAEAIFHPNEGRVPFLTSIARNGSSAIVHTRVPTESRPGHVALLAGIYEDPSALFKGWKANPVDFDSVINQSTRAWCWGSPDIVTIFNKNNLSKIHVSAYSVEMEDFGKNNTGLLDTWVFDEAIHFFNNEVKNCKSNCEEYSSSGNLFFLHLLGIDTAGHGYKPNSVEYLNNIHLVDESIEQLVEIIESVFDDKSTAYVFTSDHGMTDWGSHGSGTDHETEVPLITWGAGIKQNQERRDLPQIDIAPLLSALIGINYPVNSLGILPHDMLNMEYMQLGKLILTNVEQLFQIFKIKRDKIEKHSLFHIQFNDLDDHSVFDKFKELNALLQQKSLKQFFEKCDEFIKTIIGGVNYYHNYYKYPTLLSVSFGFIIWIYFLVLSIFNEKLSNDFLDLGTKKKLIVNFAMILVVNVLCFITKLPNCHYLYFSFPFITIFLVQITYPSYSIPPLLYNFGELLFYFIGVELLVYGFFNRLAYSFLLIVVGLLIFYSKSLQYSTNIKEKTVWVVSCFLLAIFPTLPVMKTSFNVPVYILGYVGWILLYYRMYLFNKTIYKNQSGFNISGKVFLIQFICLQLAAIYVLLLENDIISSSSNLKYLSWFLLAIPMVLIPFSGNLIAVRLVATFFGFAPFYLLVSPNYEVLFSVLYVGLLCLWLFIETKTFRYGNSYTIIYYSKFETYKARNQIGSDNLRRAFLFMVFIFLGFFGTGNIASLNSFDPMWVRAFLTVFSPFRMTGLIILKLTVPFIFACCVFRAINAIGKENVLKMFCIILFFSELMVLQFLFLITNEGSWLDIGTSLSHFLIMEAFVVILMLLYVLAHLITSFSYKIL